MRRQPAWMAISIQKQTPKDPILESFSESGKGHWKVSGYSPDFKGGTTRAEKTH